MRLSASSGLLAALVVVTGTSVFGQAVQLPTYSFTTATTTVVVPDRGSAFLGGINRGATGRSEFGTPILGKLPMANRLFKNQSIGQDRSSSSFRVTATIHDFDAMEEALLGAPPSAFSSASSPQRLAEPPAAFVGRAVQPRAANLAGNWAAKPAEPERRPPEMNLADEQSRRVQQQKTRANEAQQYFERGQQAEAEGKRGAAKVYYQMAARRADGDLKQQVLARLEAVTGARDTKIAQNEPLP